MKLLSEITINGVLHRVSDYHHNLEHKWLPSIISYTAPKIGTTSIYGGESIPKFGPRVLSPGLFNGNWPPTVNCKSCFVKDMLISDEDEECDAVTIFEGNLHLDDWDKEDVSFSAYGSDNDAETVDITLSDTLDDVFLWACDAARLNVSLDISAAARSVTLDVNYSITAGHGLRAELRSIAKYFCHAFYEAGGTIYLVDLLADNGTMTIKSSEFFSRPRYQPATPVRLIEDADYHVDGSNFYGKEIPLSPICASGQTNREAALTNVLTILEYEKLHFALTPIAAHLPKIGQKIIIVNDTHPVVTTSWLRVTDYVASTASHKIIIEGFGESS